MAYTKRDRSKWNKTGGRRKGAVTATEGRMKLREAFWIPLREQLVEHFQMYGAKTRMAQTLGISDAMLHQYSCPVCEHDTEASFSVGMGIMLYLAQHNEKARAISEASKPVERPTVTVKPVWQDEPLQTIGFINLYSKIKGLA